MVKLSSYGKSVFEVLPSGFFNLLAGGSNQEIYSECLLLIYDQFEREISYRVDRRQIREVLSNYLYDKQVSLTLDDETQKNYSDLANEIIRKMIRKNIGWLEEETDDATLEKAVYMTENGLALAEFLYSLQRPEKEEYSAYIIQIYNTLMNREPWKEHPYINGIKSISQAARALSKSLKKLSTYIRKIIERMILEESFESLTDHLIEYFDGGFVKEYARLTKQQNVYRYRGTIRSELDRICEDEDLMMRMRRECAKEEELGEQGSEEYLDDLFRQTRRFLFDDYEKIMKDLKHKINIYLQVGIGRARFLRNREIDEKNYVERTIRIISQEYSELSMRGLLPEELCPLFTLDRNEFIDTQSIRFPGRDKSILKATQADTEELTDEMLEAARAQQEREAFNPYEKELMRQYLEKCLDGRRQINAEELPVSKKTELMATLSAVAYAKENGFGIEVRDGYLETNGLLLRRFIIRKEEL